MSFFHASFRTYTFSLVFGMLFIAMVSWAIKRQDPSKHPREFFQTPEHISRSVEPSGVPEIDILNNLDAHWYLDIASYGYKYLEPQGNPVFFPLYPYLIRWTSKSLGIHPTKAGIYLSRTFFLLSLLLFTYLYAHFRSPFAKPGFPDYAVFVFHPMAFIFLCIYPESLFLFLLLATFVFFYRKQRFLFGLCAFLLVLTRPQGMFLPLAFIATDGLQILLKRKIKISLETVIAVLVTVLALSSYMFLLDQQTGKPLSFWTLREGWDAQASNWNILRILLMPKIEPYRYLHFTVFYSGIIGAIMLWRRGQQVLAMFCLICLIMPLRKGEIGDMVRYSLASLLAFVPLLESLYRYRPAVWGVLLAISGFMQGLYLQRWLQHLYVG